MKNQRRAVPLLAGGRCGADLITDLLDASEPHLVEQGDDVAMNRHHFSADRDFDIGIGGMQLVKPWQNLIIGYRLIVEKNGIARRNTDRDRVFYIRILLHGASRRQIDLDPLHMRLAQAHHHETGQKEEHDVDERDDFDARVLFW